MVRCGKGRLERASGVIGKAVLLVIWKSTCPRYLSIVFVTEVKVACDELGTRNSRTFAGSCTRMVGENLAATRASCHRSFLLKSVLVVHTNAVATLQMVCAVEPLLDDQEGGSANTYSPRDGEVLESSWFCFGKSGDAKLSPDTVPLPERNDLQFQVTSELE